MAKTITCIRCGKHAEKHGRTGICQRCYLARDDEARAAIALVHKAIRRGEMDRADAHSCVDCGKQARDYDHRDYLKPLDVVPVCRGCNVRRGTALDSVMRSIPQREAA